MNLRQAAIYLRRNKDEVRKLTAQGLIPATKIEGEWLFYQEDLEKWALANPKKAHKLNLSRGDLKALIQDTTYVKVAEELGVSPPAISYHMRKIGIWRNKRND